MRITFEPAAREELEYILRWIAKDNPRAAIAVIDRIEKRITRLALLPFTYTGRPGLVEGTRELIEWPYIIVYRIDEETAEIVIVSIVHGARDRSRPEN